MGARNSDFEISGVRNLPIFSLNLQGQKKEGTDRICSYVAFEDAAWDNSHKMRKEIKAFRDMFHIFQTKMWFPGRTNRVKDC